MIDMMDIPRLDMEAGYGKLIVKLIMKRRYKKPLKKQGTSGNHVMDEIGLAWCAN